VAAYALPFSFDGVVMKYLLRIALVFLLIAAPLGCSQPFTTQEKAAGVGTVIGSGVGAGIGSVWGYAITGGLVGAGLGLITGLLIGDHFQDLEKKQSELNRQIQQCEQELQRLCDEAEKLKQEAEEE
jgi:outer membrane lipoprotein SlyB